MKRILLLICALPCLLSAQNATVKNVLNDKMSIQQEFSQNLTAEKRNPVVLVTSVNKNLPVAISTYSDEESDDFAYTEEFDGTYVGDVSLTINAFPLDPGMLNLDIADVTLEISKGTLIFPSVAILKEGDPFTFGFEDVLFNQDGNIQAPDLISDELGFPVALKFSIVEASSAVVGDEITLTIRLVDGVLGTIADIDVIFTGTKEGEEPKEPEEPGEETDDFAYTEEFDGTYIGDVSLTINEFPLDQGMLNLEIADVTLEISKGTLVFPSVAILKEGDPFAFGFEDVLFNQDGNIQAPDLISDELGFPVALKFSIIEASSAIVGDAITLTIRLVDGVLGTIADIDVIFTGTKQGEEPKEPEEPGEETDDFAYTEEFDGTYVGDVSLTVNAFPLDPSILNLEVSDVTLEISKGTLVFPSVQILIAGDPFTIGFEDVLFNQDGNIQAPDLISDDLGFPVALKFSIIEASSSIVGDEIILTIKLVDGVTGTLADVDIVFTGTKQEGSSNAPILKGEKKAIGFYNFSGQKLEREPVSGLYIILYDNGTSQKVMKILK